MTLRVEDAALPNIPWHDRPLESSEIIWRYPANPVISRSPFPTANSVFNSAVVPFQGKFAGVFRCDDTARQMQLHVGWSMDGIDWDIDSERLKFIGADPEIAAFKYAYDPRVCWIEDRYYITWCNGYHGPTIGMGYTFDFKTFHQMENAYLPFNRNGVLFPRRINGKYVMLSRPSDSGHTPFGDIFLSQSPDMVYWGEHRHVMARRGVGKAPRSARGRFLLKPVRGG
jgi:beta-1,4-mannooligosaccharide/beta-1,4-mannosyl-N-acetylglucosamine phosphorylase